MKTNEIKTGYEKVSNQIMVDALLDEQLCDKLVSVQRQELCRIRFRLGRTNYISKPQEKYLTRLYQDVVLNNASFRSVVVKKKEKYKFKHVGMQMFFAQSASM